MNAMVDATLPSKTWVMTAQQKKPQYEGCLEYLPRQSVHHPGCMNLRVYTMGDQGMVIMLDCFDDVRKGNGSVDHCQ